MSRQSINVLFVADIVGRPGLEITTRLLPSLKEKHRIDLCIANGENGANGKGLTEKIARQYFSIGIDIITSGNHIWDNRDIFRMLNEGGRILRPHNYPRGNYGTGSVLFQIPEGPKVGIINVQGRTYMQPIDCPFRTVWQEVKRLKEKTKIIIVDFHAEATAEKMAMAWYLDGKVSAVIGTHTHVQTADERILPQGTAYITDVGMTGPYDSVIGLKKEVAIQRFVQQTPRRYEAATDNLHFCGLVVSVDGETGHATNVERLQLP